MDGNDRNMLMQLLETLEEVNTVECEKCIGAALRKQILKSVEEKGYHNMYMFGRYHVTLVADHIKNLVLGTEEVVIRIKGIEMGL